MKAHTIGLFEGLLRTAQLPVAMFATAVGLSRELGPGITTIRRVIAKHPDVPVEVLVDLASDSESAVRTAAYRHEALPHATLLHAVQTDRVSVLLEALQHRADLDPQVAGGLVDRCVDADRVSSAAAAPWLAAAGQPGMQSLLDTLVDYERTPDLDEHAWGSDDGQPSPYDGLSANVTAFATSPHREQLIDRLTSDDRIAAWWSRTVLTTASTSITADQRERLLARAVIDPLTDAAGQPLPVDVSLRLYKLHDELTDREKARISELLQAVSLAGCSRREWIERTFLRYDHARETALLERIDQAASLDELIDVFDGCPSPLPSAVVARAVGHPHCDSETAVGLSQLTDSTETGHLTALLALRPDDRAYH